MVKQKVVQHLNQLSPSSISSNPLSVVFILFSLVVIYFANQFPNNGQVGPAFFPILLSVGIIVFAAADILTGAETELEMSEYEFKPPAIVLGLLIAYLLLMPIVGFLVGTMLYMPVVLYYSNVQSKPLIAALSIGLPIALFYIFARIFLIRLPEGIIPISRLLPDLPLMVMF
ncbi:tripartite tricarboxylate transporter TctB family protein [Haloarcula sp. JP-L23]|uniref:tripartite tricarboxylate transporter TctB family protein n=1 Tax=Haloarcula sp. JP-L23 TaxID=2716717 RepID=UPI00140F26FC|nr:tripartite tricarboxylate transporter TctB family protein [Haloarcula sp. JP-L23]